MKKIFIICFVAFFCACSNYLAEDEDLNADTSKESENAVPMTLKVRSSPQETINYPVHVYIFDHTGTEVRHSEISSSQQSLNLKLPVGDYQLASFTGLDLKQYNIPDKRTIESFIETESCKPCATPLQYGFMAFNLQKKKDLSIHLSYIVSSLEFKFTGIPEDARSVEVGVSPTSHAFSLGGSYSNDNYMCRINCRHEGDNWVAGPVYILHATEVLTAYCDKGCRVGETAYTEGIGPHGLGTALDIAGHGEGDVLADFGGTGLVFAVTLRGQTASGHADMYLSGRNTGCRYADGVVETGIEHVHEVGCDSGSAGGRNDVVPQRTSLR